MALEKIKIWFQESTAIYNAEDYQKAFPLCKEAAEQRLAGAQFFCGIMKLT